MPPSPPYLTALTLVSLKLTAPVYCSPGKVPPSNTFRS